MASSPRTVRVFYSVDFVYSYSDTEARIKAYRSAKARVNQMAEIFEGESLNEEGILAKESKTDLLLSFNYYARSELKGFDPKKTSCVGACLSLIAMDARKLNLYSVKAAQRGRAEELTLEADYDFSKRRLTIHTSKLPSQITSMFPKIIDFIKVTSLVDKTKNK